MIVLIISLLVFLSVLSALFFDVFNALSAAMHSLEFRLLRLSVWLPTGVCYAFFYASRYNVAAGNVESVRETLGFSSTQFATVITAGFWTYALTAPLTGMISDKLGGRAGLLISSIGAGLSNLCLGFAFKDLHTTSSNMFMVFIVLYSMNIMFQGFGTSAVVKVNAGWYTPLERGFFSGIYNVLLTSGYYMALGGCPVVVATIGWSYVFLIPGGMLLCCAVAMSILLRESPDEYYKSLIKLGDDGDEEAPLLKPVPKYTDVPEKTVPSGSAQNTSSSSFDQSLSVLGLLQNSTFLCYLISIMCLCWVRDGLITWIYSYLEKSRGKPLSPDTTAMIGGSITLGGFVGGVLCGIVSDYVFKGNRSKPILLFSFFQLISLGLTYYVVGLGSDSDLLVAFLVFLTATFMLGNYTLLSYTIPTDLPAPVVATAAGIMTAAGYVASGLAGLGMGKLIEVYSWGGWFGSLELATALGSLAIYVGSVMAARGKKSSSSVRFSEPVRDPFPDRATTGLRSKLKGVDQRSSDKLDLLAFVVIGGDAAVLPPAATQMSVKMSGIQDEFLRTRVGENGFFLWDGNGSVGERLAWKLATASPSRAHRGFLKRRQNDPTSYFGKTNTSKLGMGMGMETKGRGNLHAGKSKISPF
ncbi:hypothetical protein TrST_g7732 [Triparma strigata]|uniref:Major facilitator superfamily (MFS) profile domain-containing protein n=1 Tax=Triparma strigata TaxID=1606541 RepID=A0A9W7DXR9_9STRA|nr:hypothetical protein TrST_g7732 [Triparma strigata]